MANITITPTGAAFNPTDTVTSTRLNEARNPTAALVPASVLPTDLSLGAPQWDTSSNISTGSIFTSNQAIEINAGGTGDRNAYVDFHTAGPGNTDYNARIYRSGGLDSDLQILNSGTGTTVVSSTIDQINSNVNSITTKAYVDGTAAGTSSFTTEDGQSAGYQVFPSGLKMAWGDSTAALDGIITFPLGVGFTVAPTVQISYNKGTNSGIYYGAQVADVTTTNFVYHGSYANLYGPRYLAIGI